MKGRNKILLKNLLNNKHQKNKIGVITKRESSKKKHKNRHF